MRVFWSLSALLLLLCFGCSSSNSQLDAVGETASPDVSTVGTDVSTDVSDVSAADLLDGDKLAPSDAVDSTTGLRIRWQYRPTIEGRAVVVITKPLSAGGVIALVHLKGSGTFPRSSGEPLTFDGVDEKGYLLALFVSNDGSVQKARLLVSNITQTQAWSYRVHDADDTRFLLVGLRAAGAIYAVDPTLPEMPADGHAWLVLPFSFAGSVGNPVQAWSKGWLEIGAARRLDDGSLLIGGHFIDSLNVGGLVLSEPPGQKPTTLSGRGFLVRVSPAGSALWSTVIHGNAASHVAGILALEADTTIVCGNFGDYEPVNGASGIFGPGEPNETTLISRASDDDPAADSFIAAFKAGKLLWVRKLPTYTWTTTECGLYRTPEGRSWFYARRYPGRHLDDPAQLFEEDGVQLVEIDPPTGTLTLRKTLAFGNLTLATPGGLLTLSTIYKNVTIEADDGQVTLQPPFSKQARGWFQIPALVAADLTGKITRVVHPNSLVQKEANLTDWKFRWGPLSDGARYLACDGKTSVTWWLEQPLGPQALTTPVGGFLLLAVDY